MKKLCSTCQLEVKPKEWASEPDKKAVRLSRYVFCPHCGAKYKRKVRAFGLLLIVAGSFTGVLAPFNGYVWQGMLVGFGLTAPVLFMDWFISLKRENKL